VIFHRLQTGKPPIEVARKASYFDWLMAHEQDHELEVQAPPGLPPLPSEVVHVARRMLARRREDRPSSYEEIIEILDGAQRRLEPHLEPDEETIATLPMPAPERISSSGGRPTPAGATPSGAKSLPERPPVSVRPPAIAAVPPPPHPLPFEPAGREAAADEAKRWPDLAETAPTQALTGKSQAAPEPLKPPAVTPPPPFSRSRDEEPVRASGTEPPPPAPPAIRPPPLAPPIWAGGAVAGDTGPREAELPPSGVSDKTERIDDVVAKLKQHAAVAPASARSAPVPTPVASAPPAPAVAPEEKQAKRVPPRPSAEAGRPARRLVVYGAPPAPVPAAPQGLPAPPVPPKGAGSRDRTLRAVGIALIVAAIVVLFASVLWFLASLARGPSRGARPAGPGTLLAGIAGESPGLPPFAAPQVTKEGS
jgi:hypothetical protein